MSGLKPGDPYAGLFESALSVRLTGYTITTLHSLYVYNILNPPYHNGHKKPQDQPCSHSDLIPFYFHQVQAHQPLFCSLKWKAISFLPLGLCTCCFLCQEQHDSLLLIIQVSAYLLPLQRSCHCSLPKVFPTPIL